VSRASADRGQAPPAAAELELTLGPVEAEVFFAKHWEREPLVVARSDRGRFDAILSLADAERIVCETAIRTPAFRLVKDGAPIPGQSYTRDLGWSGGSSFTGLARVDRVAEEYATGATIVLQALHLNWHPAALYCRGLESSFGCPVQTNAYWTPATARGLDVHHDTHDVFILQVAGHKRWLLYEPVVELPLRDQRWRHGVDDAGEPVADVMLEPGDTLYLPRGCPHQATAEAGDSLHLTVGVHVTTRLDAVKAALRSCEEDVEFRRSVGADGKLPDDLIQILTARLAPEQVARRARQRFVNRRYPILDDQIAQVRDLDSLGLDDPLVRRSTVISDLEETETEAVLRFEGKEVRFPAHAREAVMRAHAAGGAFTAADLPGALDGPGRLVLVRRLVREGFLRRL
jgi:bifunctional lysine-specific demethylase and histidyl-hydroxylase NO66